MATNQSEYNVIGQEITPYFIGGRTESASLLVWFLENVWGLDPAEVESAVCDGPGDKGIDGLTVNPDLQEIVVFQSQYCKKSTGKTGDSKLRQFVGTEVYFKDKAGIQHLLASKPNPELQALINRSKVEELLNETDTPYSVRLVYVTNCPADKAALNYLPTSGIDMWDQSRIASAALRIKRPDLLSETVQLYPRDLMKVVLEDDVSIYFALVRGEELATLPGIDDLSIFNQNVRLGLGNTKINKELREAIENTSTHHLFPSFHNGLTILTRGVQEDDKGAIALDSVSVVNGCQSLLTLYRSRAYLTPDLTLLVRIIQLNKDADLVDLVTYRTNNQNPVNIRDQRSNASTQRSLQVQMDELYGDKVFYGVKRGEKGSDDVPVFENGLAAQMITSMWLKQPALAVKKNSLFSDEHYYRIFNHSIDAHKIYLTYLVDKIVTSRKSDLPPQLQSSFSAVRFTIAHLVSEALRQGGRGGELLEHPEKWLPESEAAILQSLEQFTELVMLVIGQYVNEKMNESPEFADTYDASFDPKVAFKNLSKIREVQDRLLIASRSESYRLEKKGEPYYFNVPPTKD